MIDVLRQIVMLKWSRPLAKAEISEVGAALENLGQSACGVRYLSHGPDISSLARNADYAVVTDFEDLDGFEAYQSHPQHDVVRRMLTPFTEERWRVMFMLPDENAVGQSG